MINMKYDKIELSYSFNSLEPYIDEETVRIHYTKHLQGYVDKINEVLAGCDKFTKGRSLEEILTKVNKIPPKIRKAVINYGGGVVNHNLYFTILSANPKLMPEGKLMKKINDTFGCIDEMKKLINEVSLNQFGSGYGWLVKDKHDNLKIMSTLNQDSPYSFGFKPLLTIDVWEHAYYLKYKNNRKEYIENIWNLIDWAKIENIYNS